MASVTSEIFRFDGMRELMQAMDGLVPELKGEVAPIVGDTVENCAADVRDQYADGESGNLDKGVTTHMDTPLSGRVRSGAPHAHIYEFGTVKRYTKRTGANRGVMPAGGPVMVPTAIKHREQMLRKCEDVLRKPRPKIGDGSMV